MSDELNWMTGHELAGRIARRDVSPVEVVDAVLAQLERTEPHLNAFVTVTADAARRQAREAEAAVMRSDPDSLPALFGVPITVKDLCDTAGVRTTYGSKAFADHVPAEDAVSWSRLKSAGAILIGKTTTPEFGMLGVTYSGLTGTTNNPWKVTHTAGGSSGGAAASVAAGVGPLAWGSDGGGSVRIPASFCGLVGLKPSRGRVPVASAWETVGTDGPLTRTVADAALLLSITAGPHPTDPLTLPALTDDVVGAALDPSGFGGLRIAFAPAPAGANVDDEVARIVAAAAAAIASDGGAFVEQIDLDMPDPVAYFDAFWSVAVAAGADVPDGVELWTETEATLHFIEIGKRMSAVEYYRTAHETRGKYTAAYNEVFAAHDLLITPTSTVAAFPHPGAEAGVTAINGLPVARPSLDFHRLTETPSHAGLPAITVPCGFTAEGLPVGLQIIGPLHADLAVIAAAAAFERLRPWALHRPSFG
jgi:Asp-tRNA(Asn)/Glu-tRNA(Gln) amidotransferase A subunit family amidase